MVSPCSYERTARELADTHERTTEMAPYLSQLLNDSTISHLLVSSEHQSIPALLEELTLKNTTHSAELETKLEDAVKNLGETEVSDALRAKALYLARIGHKVRPSTLSIQCTNANAAMTVCRNSLSPHTKRLWSKWQG